jgi:hypothetical protein
MQRSIARDGWKDVHGATFHPNLAGAQATAATISQALDRMASPSRRSRW